METRVCGRWIDELGGTHRCGKPAAAFVASPWSPGWWACDRHAKEIEAGARRAGKRSTVRWMPKEGTHEKQQG